MDTDTVTEADLAVEAVDDGHAGHPELVIDDRLAPACIHPTGGIDWLHPQLAADFDVIDLFAAGGGWDEGARLLGASDRILGIEWDEPACRTAIAAGHRRLMADIALLNPRWFTTGGRRIRGLIASPPCQGFSLAGDGAGRRDTEHILTAVRMIDDGADPEDAIAWLRSAVEDPVKSALVLEPLRWLLALEPDWFAAEQVPAVLPLWKACAKVARKRGYKVWTGILNAADYGVAQTRRRAIWLCARDRFVTMPEPTHAKGGADATLFNPDPLPDWVSMATALGWRSELVGFPRRADSDRDGGRVASIAGTEYRARDLVGTDEPAQTVTEKIRSWQRYPLGTVELHGGIADEDRKATVRAADEPAPTLAFGHNAAQWRWRLSDGAVEPLSYVNGTHDHAARRPADEPAPTVMFGARLNTVEWVGGVEVLEDPTLDPDVLEFRQLDGTVVGRMTLAADDEGRPAYMLTGGIAGDGPPRSVDEPAPTLSGAGAACWVRSKDEWIRSERLASGETPKGRQPEMFDRPAPTIVTTRRSKDGLILGRRLPPGESESRGGWEWREGQSFCLFCRCSDDLHDADGACSGCQAGLIGGTLPHCTWESWADPDEWPELRQLLTRADGTGVSINDQSGEGVDGSWTLTRPATSVLGDPRVRHPGQTTNTANGATKSRNDGVRVTIAEAAILQSFRPDYPWQGTKTQQYQQVGNACPPRLSAHILAEAMGVAPPTFEECR